MTIPTESTEQRIAKILCHKHSRKLSECQICPICEWMEQVHSEAIENLQSELRAALADKERMDWLENNSAKTVREAIDALSKEKP